MHPAITSKAVFSTGDVAKICKVAPRTATEWFDSGRLRGYRIPGSQHHRIPRANLVRFLTEHGMPLHGLDAGTTRILLVGAANWTICPIHLCLKNPDVVYETAVDGFDAGRMYEATRPQVVIVDLAMGRQGAIEVTQRIGLLSKGRTLVIGLANEDEPDEGELLAKGFGRVFRKPVDPQEVAGVIEAAVTENE